MIHSPYRQAANRFLRKALPRQRGSQGLDIGGAGARSRETWPAGQQWRVLDPAEATAAYPCRLEDAKVPSRYDILKVTDVLYLLPDPEAALRRMREWIRHDGHLVVTVPVCTELAADHYWRGSETAWRKTLEAAGWFSVEITPLGGRWTLLCHLLDTLNVWGLRWLVRRLTPLALAADRRWPSGWIVGYGITARKLLREDEPGPGFRRSWLSDAAWQTLGLASPS